MLFRGGSRVAVGSMALDVGMTAAGPGPEDGESAGVAVDEPPVVGVGATVPVRAMETPLACGVAVGAGPEGFAMDGISTDVPGVVVSD